MKLSLAMIALALVLFGISFALPPFRGGVDGHGWQYSVPDGNSELYDSAREKALTLKYPLQDYGGTLFFCGLFLFVYCKLGRLIAPSSRAGFVALALLASIASAFSIAFGLWQEMLRCEFPPWADSFGIPLMGLVVVFVFALIWALAHFTLLAGVRRRSSISLSIVAIRHAHLWLRFVSVVTILLLVFWVLEGAYWLVIAGLIWLYFYLSIAAVRHEP